MQPDESGAGAPAVEVAVEQRLPTFVHGALAGLAAAAVLAQVWMALQLDAWRAMYRDWGAFRPESLGGPTYPFVLHRAWQWGVPAAGAIAVIALVVARPRRLAWYLVLAAALIVAVVATYYIAQSPVRELAGRISE